VKEAVINSLFFYPEGLIIIPLKHSVCYTENFFTWLYLFFVPGLLLPPVPTKQWFHPLVAEYGGDIIWAGMFLFLLRIFFSKMKRWKLALICYAMGVADELLQLYHSPWIESIRQTRVGGLVLGFGFMWSDIICYAIGVVLAFLLISFIERNDN
jgi:hypothetical protein